MSDFPATYDPSRIGSLFYPDVAAIAAAAYTAALPSAASDAEQTDLVIIDMQIDFGHRDGSLYVPGALDDIRRLIEFIYRHAGRISQISCSLDTHLPHQIFSPGWWVDGNGRHPAPFTIISADDVAGGRWRPVRDHDWSIAYIRRLEAEAKKQLTVWPYHVLQGSIGHALDPELWSAIFWHSLARGTQPRWIVKGSVPQTEHYSIIRPEVPLPDHPGGETNWPFLERLAAADRIFIAGEASSHCVLETVEDLVELYAGKPEQLRKIHFLRDCSSPVQHPEVDFAALAQDRFATFSAMGIQLVDSTGAW